MGTDAAAVEWARGNLGPAGMELRPVTRARRLEADKGAKEIRTSYYETKVKRVDPPGPFEPGPSLQLALLDNQHVAVILGGTELPPDDYTLTAPGDYLKIQFHVSPETCNLNRNLYRSGSFTFGESAGAFKGLIHDTCGGEGWILQVVGTPIPWARLNLDDLLTMHDGGDARTALPGQPSVRRKVYERFEERLKASPDVQRVFFSNVRSDVRVPDEGWVRSMAVALVCTAVGELNTRNFRQLVDVGAASQYLDAQFNSPAAMACGQAIYDVAYDEFALSSKGVRFSEYLQERQRWGSALSNWVRGQMFLTSIGARFSIGDVLDTNKMLNRALYLLKRFGVSSQEIDSICAEFRTFTEWGEDSPGKYLNRTDFPNSKFSGEVNTVGAQERTQHHTVVPMRGGSIPTWTVYYGENLVNFLNEHAGSFRTSTRADYIEIKNGLSSLFCFVAGTPIQLADGRQVAIESIQPGERVLAGDGSTTVRCAEEIVYPGSEEEGLYGINQLAPFFTGGHMLLTTRGWRAIDPDAPRKENPGVEVDRLEIGDKVIRLASTNPFRVEEVEVESLPCQMLNAESRVYGLKLDGVQSYFASGIAVSANYPNLTEERIAEGIRSLSDSERAALLETLNPVMPLLVEAIRDFAGPRLYGALGMDLEARAE